MEDVQDPDIRQGSVFVESIAVGVCGSVLRALPAMAGAPGSPPLHGWAG
jgi:hypothetical protein